MLAEKKQHQIGRQHTHTHEPKEDYTRKTKQENFDAFAFTANRKINQSIFPSICARKILCIWLETVFRNLLFVYRAFVIAGWWREWLNAQRSHSKPKTSKVNDTVAVIRLHFDCWSIFAFHSTPRNICEHMKALCVCLKSLLVNIFYRKSAWKQEKKKATRQKCNTQKK